MKRDAYRRNQLAIQNAESFVDLEVFTGLTGKEKATEAIRKGLEPLAKQILTYPLEFDRDETALYLNEEVTSAIEAIREPNTRRIVSDNADYRKWIEIIHIRMAANH